MFSFPFQKQRDRHKHFYKDSKQLAKSRQCGKLMANSMMKEVKRISESDPLPPYEVQTASHYVLCIYPSSVPLHRFWNNYRKLQHRPQPRIISSIFNVILLTQSKMKRAYRIVLTFSYVLHPPPNTDKRTLHDLLRANSIAKRVKVQNSTQKNLVSQQPQEPVTWDPDGTPSF